MGIKIYTTPTCKWCNLLREHLDSKNISYEDVNVSKDRFSALEMIRKSGQSAVPVIEIDCNIIVGFDKEHIDMLLTKQLICKL
ncbi:MAG: glutaredoxin domain-containing protein [Ruminiclostridium sp.]